MHSQLDQAWWSLRLAFFAGPFLAGVDKFFHVLTNWDMYLSPFFAQFLPISGHSFMLLVGVVEMAVGVMVLVGLTRIGGYLAAAWLLAIIINLLSMGAYYDIALRDLGLALSAFGMARLTEAREASALIVGPAETRIAA
jgi:uncharacterized membrane protein YphA (DoxX/SURF4 family)